MVQRILQHGILYHRHFDGCPIIQKFGMEAPAISECRSRRFRPIPSSNAIQRNRDAARFDHQLGKIRSVPAQGSTASQTALVVESSMRQNKHVVPRIQRIPHSHRKPHPIRRDVRRERSGHIRWG